MNNRNSSFELLRVVAILFVVTHHVLLFGADLCGYLSPFHPDASGIAAVLINSVIVTGVSLFVMISGWFGIRKVWRPMVRLIIEVALFGALSLGICLLLYHFCPIAKASGTWSLQRLWLSIKFTNWWFIVHYLLLVLCAPLIEKCLEAVTQRQAEKIILCLMVANFVFGFAWGYVNSNGYNVVQFVLLYVIARYMRLFPESKANRLVCRFAWLIIAVCAASIAGIYLLDSTCWAPGHNAIVWNYNCPLVVVEAAAIFSLFTRLKFQSAAVNNTAALILGVYLIQSSPNLIYYRNALGQWLYGEWGFAGIAATVVIIVAICLALSAAVLLPARILLRKIGL